MKRRYKILQKKLQDLESDLARIFSKPNPPEPRDLESIDNQFSFLGTLLSAEISSNPSKPNHLAHIANRVTQLRAGFDNRVANGPSVPDQVGSGSDCSCTDSCLNDDEDEHEEELFYEPVDEEVFYEDEPVRVLEEKEANWGYGPVLAAIFGAVLMGLLGNLYGCFRYYVEYEGSLVPT